VILVLIQDMVHQDRDLEDGLLVVVEEEIMTLHPLMVVLLPMVVEEELVVRVFLIHQFLEPDKITLAAVAAVEED
tara:strand:+ start:188 stop:412 length:225 start_codon:yes stop_codon:yes gene_type:complete